MNSFEYCEECKVARWIYEMNGDIICNENCPYKKERDKNADERDRK